MILTMAKRKKKTVPRKLGTNDTEKESASKSTPLPQDEDEEGLPSFGILPSRDLKKNLGCG